MYYRVDEPGLLHRIYNYRNLYTTGIAKRERQSQNGNGMLETRIYSTTILVQLIENFAICGRCSLELGGASAAQPASPWPVGNVMNINDKLY